MATQNVCKFFKFGYCKHREFCRRHHEKKICETPECDISKCIFRHPKPCKYFRDYGQCKFDPCMFLHVEHVKDSQIDQLKQENETILKDIANLKTTIKDLDDKKLKSQDIIDKLVNVEKKFERVVVMEKTTFEQASAIKTLTSKVTSLENRLNEKDDIIKDLEKMINKEKKHGMIKCKFCDFETFSGPGLKIHMRKKHTSKAIEKYPIKCDLCHEQIGK